MIFTGRDTAKAVSLFLTHSPVQRNYAAKAAHGAGAEGKSLHGSAIQKQVSQIEDTSL